MANRVQEHGFVAEERFAKRNGLTLVSGSGSGRRKGDCKSDKALYQLKATKAKSFRLHSHLFLSTIDDAMQYGLDPRVVILFVEATNSMGVIFYRVHDLDFVEEDFFDSFGYWITQKITLPPNPTQESSMTITREQVVAESVFKFKDEEDTVWIGIPEKMFPKEYL